MLGVSSGSGLSLFDWDSLKLIRRIDIQPTHVYWAENASLVALATADQYFILKFHADAVNNAPENAEDIEDAFEVICDSNLASIIPKVVLNVTNFNNFRTFRWSRK